MLKTINTKVGVATAVRTAATSHATRTAAAVAAAGKHRVAAATEASVRPYVET